MSETACLPYTPPTFESLLGRVYATDQVRFNWVPGVIFYDNEIGIDFPDTEGENAARDSWIMEFAHEFAGMPQNTTQDMSKWHYYELITIVEWMESGHKPGEAKWAK